MGSAIMVPEGEDRIIVSPSGVPDKIGRTLQASQSQTKEQIQRLVEDALAERLLAREFGAGDTVSVRKDGDHLAFVKKEEKQAAKEPEHAQ